MEAFGELIIGLHRNLEEIRSSLDATGAAQNTQQGLLLQSTIDRAEYALRKQARDVCSAYQGAAVAVGPTCGFARNASPVVAAQATRRSAPGGGPLPPPRSPAPPGGGCDARAGSADVVRQRPLRAPANGSRNRAKTSAHQRLLPKPNRLDPLADPPAISERDLDGGLLNLSTRGFIPPAADLTPAMERGMPVMTQRPAPLYDQALRRERREIAPADDHLYVRLDPNGPPKHGRVASEEPGSRGPRQQHLPPLRPPPLSPATSLRALPAPPAESPGSVPGAGGSAVAQSFGTFCTELLEAAPAEPGTAALALPGPSEAEIRAAAATRIAAAWRGCKERRRFLLLLKADRAARQIQSAWLAAMTRMATRAELSRIQEEDRKLHTRLMYELGQDWFQTKQQRRIEIHVCSLTVAEGRRRRTDDFQELQASQIARVFRLMDSRRDVIFVAPRQLHEDILDYYAKIMQFRGIKNPPGRFQVVVPEHTDLHPRLSLTQSLLCSPKAMKRLRKLTNGRQAYVIPGMVTHAELKLCNQLKLPLLGAGPRNMVLLSSKSNCKKLAQLAELPIGPWAVDIYDEDEFFASLAGLVVKHPQVRTWLFKIDDERSSRGHAYLDLWKLREVSESLRFTLQAGGGEAGGAQPHGNSDEPAVLGADANEVRQLLRRHVPRRAVLCNRGAYPDFAAWMAEASRVGAVIQAVPDEIVSQTTVHLQIEPDGSTCVMGTSESLMCQPFVRAASWFPHTRGSWEVLHEAGIRMGRTLAAKGLMGFASVDIVFFENPDFDPAALAQQEREPTPQVIGGAATPVDLLFRDLRSPSPEMGPAGEEGRMLPAPSLSSLPASRQADYELAMHLQSQPPAAAALDPVSMMLGVSPEVGPSAASRHGCWVVDVDARLTEEAAALFPLQFVAQVKLEPVSGMLRMSGDAAQQQQQQQEDGTGQPREDQRGERLNRWAIATAAAIAPGLEKTSYQALFKAAKMRGVSFDLFHNIGCVFTFLDVFHSLFSLLSVEKTPENCVKRLASATGTLTEGSNQPSAPRGQQGSDGAGDGLTVSDLQMALRVAQRRLGEKPAK